MQAMKIGAVPSSTQRMTLASTRIPNAIATKMPAKSMIIMLFAGIFVAIALGILVLAKVILWVLLGTAPIFIACMFFNVTRNYALGWINQCLLYAMIPLFVYVVAAFLIAAMEPELTKIDQISGNRELKLSDFAAFIMLC